MLNSKSAFLLILLFVSTLFSCSSSSKEKETETEIDIYEKMHIVFEGRPEVDKIKPLMEEVIKAYNLPENDDSRNRVGSMLVSLRESSVVGVTEMDILKHMYQHGSTSISITDQAAISATVLEKTK